MWQPALHDGRLIASQVVTSQKLCANEILLILTRCNAKRHIGLRWGEKKKKPPTRMKTRLSLCDETKCNKQRSWKPPEIKRERTCLDKKPCRGHGNRVFFLRDRYAGNSVLKADETPAGICSTRDKKYTSSRAYSAISRRQSLS